jgi:phenylacetate-CoA ligase
LLFLSFHPGGIYGRKRCGQLGCTVIPAGIGQTEMQVQAMAELRPDAYIGTPSF